MGKRGKVIILAAPSGSGKTTIARYLLGTFPEALQFSVSGTTREKRGTEVDGKDYYFMQVDDFQQAIARGEFVEHEQVYDGIYYGTLKSEIERIWESGKHIIFDVDVVGGISLKKYFGEQALAVFVYPPSMEAVEQRLRARKTESEEALQMRLVKTKDELTYTKPYDVVLVNDILEESLQKAQELVNEFLDR
jgi:guanylate kinase